jgi:hypothetical protein
LYQWQTGAGQINLYQWHPVASHINQCARMESTSPAGVMHTFSIAAGQPCKQRQPKNFTTVVPNPRRSHVWLLTFHGRPAPTSVTQLCGSRQQHMQGHKHPLQQNPSWTTHMHSCRTVLPSWTTHMHSCRTVLPSWTTHMHSCRTALPRQSETDPIIESSRHVLPKVGRQQPLLVPRLSTAECGASLHRSCWTVLLHTSSRHTMHRASSDCQQQLAVPVRQCCLQCQSTMCCIR